MSEPKKKKKKKQQRIYDLLNAETKKKKKKNLRNNWNFFQVFIKPDHNHLDYALWGILENKTHATSHLNIGSLKTAIEEEWNKMSEEFILKACKSF